MPRPVTQAPPASRREAVQPSLWDRLVDDLPGLVHDTEARQAEFAAGIGSERLARLLAEGTRGIEREEGLDDQQRRGIAALAAQMERRAFLEKRGVVVTPEVLREAVRRDVEELFSIERHEVRLLLSDGERGEATDPADRLADFPHVRRSVLNFGIPSFSGRRASDFDPETLARELREVLAVFEPRLKRDTIRVTVAPGERLGLSIGIEAVLMLSPVPERLRLSTLVDLDTGSAATVIEEG